MAAVEVFRTADVAVRQWQGFSRDCCFVTFDSFTDDRRLDRHGFAESFLGESRIDGVHLLTRDNDWYQYADFLDVCARVRALTEGYDRVIAYGSSMGAYAAIRFGGLVGADTALALSPQFSIDPRLVPFENRWLHDAKRIVPLYEAEPSPFVPRAIVIYDKHDPDARHVDLYRDKTEVVDVQLLNCGHPCTGYLVELRLLQDCCRAVARGDFDPGQFQVEARARRKEAGQFYVALALKARAKNLRQRLLELAVARSPENFGYLAQLATTAAENGEYGLAADALARGTTIAPGHPVMRFNRSRVLQLQGDLEGAVDLMAGLARESSLYEQPWLSLRTLMERADAATWTAPASDLGRPSIAEPHRGWTLARMRRQLAGSAFHLLHGRGVPPNSRRTVLPTIERASPETRVTTYPSPPPFALSWRRHDKLMRAVPRGRIDLLLVGDSLAEYWPEYFWAPWRVFNFGVGADKVQHVIWRLDEISRRIAAARVLLVIGTNNLGAGDTPEGILAGIRESLRRLALAAPGAEVAVLEIPPCGPEFDFRDADRKRANQLLREAAIVRTINADADLLTADHASNPYYQPDHIHLSVQGYDLLTRLVREAWAVSPDT